jgi:hypothetical protein
MAIEIRKHSLETVVSSMATAFKQHVCLLLCVPYVLLCGPFATAAQDGWSASGFQGETDNDTDDEAPFVFQQERRQRADDAFKMRLAANWFADSSRFWYRNDLKGGLRQFIVVDAKAGRGEESPQSILADLRDEDKNGRVGERREPSLKREPADVF